MWDPKKVRAGSEKTHSGSTTLGFKETFWLTGWRVQDMGFEFLHEERNVRSNYDQNPRNMLKYTYDSVFFVSQKL